MAANVKNFMVGNDPVTIEQINEFANSPAYRGCKIRIMPDAHAGKGAVVGSTIEFKDKIVPGTVGVDIACRVSAFRVNSNVIDCEYLDQVCREYIPTGFDVRSVEHELSVDFPYEELYCWNELKNQDRLRKSMGTLGGGNHYLELDHDIANDQYWFVIHCGSRNLGKQIAEYYQHIAIVRRDERIAEHRLHQKMGIAALRAINRIDRIQGWIELCREVIAAEPQDDLCYLEGEDMEHYLHDMRICNEFSYRSHMAIYREVAKCMGWAFDPQKITCIHNYVDVDHHIIRKGAIEGYAGKIGLIPLNMRDGILVVCSLGNEDWNCSLPHGAGRVMSRGEARKALSLSDFQSAMDGIVSSSVVEETLDEAPMAYKDAEAIIQAIRPNAMIVAQMYPVWNFKAK